MNKDAELNWLHGTDLLDLVMNDASPAVIAKYVVGHIGNLDEAEIVARKMLKRIEAQRATEKMEG